MTGIKDILNKKKPFNLLKEIPIFSLAFFCFGILLVFFSFRTWFPHDLMRFSLGLIGSAFIVVLGYFKFYDKKKSEDAETKFDKAFEEIENLRKDFSTLDTKVNDLETKFIDFKNG